jgi:hypothetical protein
MTAQIDTSATPASQERKLRVLLLIIAIIESVSSLSSLPVIFADRAELLGTGFMGWVLTVELAVMPIIAIVAAVHAFKGRLRHAIVVLATLILVTWLTDLPSLFSHGLELNGSFFVVLHGLAQAVAYPILALTAALFALKNERLGLAAIFVSLPTIISILGVIAFAIGVSIYGF